MKHWQRLALVLTLAMQPFTVALADPSAAEPGAAGPPPASDAAAPAPPVGATSTPTAPTTPPAELTAPPQASPSTRPIVVIVITQQLRDAKWARESSDTMITGGDEVNNVADAINTRAQAMLAAMGMDARAVFAADGKVDGARFYLTPTIKQLQQTTALFAFSKISDTMALEWRVTDANGSTVMLDTVVAEANGMAGNIFTSHFEQVGRFRLMMDNAFAKSRTLLEPVLSHS